MFNIVLDEYKETRIYFQLFDVILKNIEITKESFLLEHKIILFISYLLVRLDGVVILEKYSLFALYVFEYSHPLLRPLCLLPSYEALY